MAATNSKDRLRAINAVLSKLANDEDLQDDFTLPAVQVAIKHWTGTHRLDPEKAQSLQNNRRVIYVLQRFQMLQSVCKEAMMPVPLDHLLQRKSELDANVVRQFFPQLAISSDPNKQPNPLSVKSSSKSKGEINAPLAAKKSVTAKGEETCKEPAAKPRDEPAVSQPSKSTDLPPSQVEANGIDVNTILKGVIALVVALIAVTLSLLYSRLR